ncbi:MAG: hypothetical protein JXR84_01945 [Anaerolineae bacterium]|nr:hypothetical protein [Anaerolineae bacterium]
MSLADLPLRRGGDVSSIEFLDEELRERLLANCPGPYWGVGDVAAPMEKSSEAGE